MAYLGDMWRGTCSYFQVHDTMRGITGIGEGNGPYMVIHDGFQSLTTWYNFLPGSDRIAMGKSVLQYETR